VDRIAEKLENSQVIAQNREFYTVTGTYHGMRFSGVSSGIGAPSAAIALEELAQCGIRALVRVGTMMGVDLPMGTCVLSVGAARFEGTSTAYLPMPFPAVADWSLVQSLYAAGQAQGLSLRTGITATYDAYYPRMAPGLVGHSELDLTLLRQAGVIALDMETALLYILGMRLRIPVAAMCLVTNNANPFAILEADGRTQGEQNLIQAVLQGLVDWSRSQHG
jgi:uridine phosphorylase